MYKRDQPMGPPNVSMLERRCAICGKPVPKRRHLYCSDVCARQGERDRARERYTPKAATRPGPWRETTCIVCGNMFYGHIRSTRCPECQAARDKETTRQYKARKRAGTSRLIGSTAYCEKCGEPYTVTSGLQRYCKVCAPAALKESKNEISRKWNREHYADPATREAKNECARRTDPARKVCPVCGNEFDAPNAKWKYCSPECRQQGLKQYWQAYDYVRHKPNGGKEPPAT